MQVEAATCSDNSIEMPAPFPWIRHKKLSESRTESLRGYCGETGSHIRLGVMEDRIGT